MNGLSWLLLGQLEKDLAEEELREKRENLAYIEGDTECDWVLVKDVIQREEEKHDYITQ